MKHIKPRKFVTIGKLPIRVGDKVLYLTLTEVRALYRSIGSIFKEEDPIQWTLSVGNSVCDGNDLEIKCK